VAKKTKIAADKLELSAEVLRALSHPVRLKILSYISKNKEVNVNTIYRELKLEQSITSQHLKILRDNELVTSARDGKMVFYTVEFSKIKAIQAILSTFF
jgi:DNA-binding transcriptional ArsR family regulator